MTSLMIRLTFNRPVHAATNATHRIRTTGAAAGQLLKHGDHAIRIEAAIWKVDVRVDANLQLFVLFSGIRVDSRGCQALNMLSKRLLGFTT